MSEPIQIGDHIKLARRWIKLGSGYSNVENFKFIPEGTKTLPPAMNGEAEDRYVVVVETNDKKTTLKPTDPKRKISIHVDTADLNVEGSTTIPIADYFAPRAASIAAPLNDKTTQSSFEKFIRSNSAVATTLGIIAAPAVAFGTAVAISGADALIHVQDRQQACDAKIISLTADFYARAPEGETPIFDNISLDADEIPSWLQESVRIPEQCAPQTNKETPAYLRKLMN